MCGSDIVAIWLPLHMKLFPSSSLSLRDITWRKTTSVPDSSSKFSHNPLPLCQARQQFGELKSKIPSNANQLLKKLKFSFKCNFHRHFNKDWISSGDLGGNWPFGHPEALTSQTAHIYQPKWICQVGNLISINPSFTTDQAS